MGLFDFLLKIFGSPVIGEYERVLQQYNQALAINDTDPDIWDKKCFVLIQLGRYEEAIEAGKKGVSLAPDNPEIWDTLFNASKLGKNRELADECRKRVSILIKQKREAEGQRISEIPKKVMRDSRKKCYYCGQNVSEIIQCGPCGRYFCHECWKEHQWIHGKSPSIGISYQSDGSYSGYDGTEQLK